MFLIFASFFFFLLWFRAWFDSSFRIQHSYLVATEQVFIFAKVSLESTCFAFVKDLTKGTGLKIKILLNKVWQLPISTIPKYFVTRCVACFRKLECSLFLKSLKYDTDQHFLTFALNCELFPPLTTHTLSTSYKRHTHGFPHSPNS